MWFILLACKAPPELSPATLDDLSRVALKNFDAESEPEDIDALLEWLVTHDTPESNGWFLEAIRAEDVVGLELDPDIDIHDLEEGGEMETGGAGVIDVVDGDLDGYASASMEEDQSFAHSTYKQWTRVILSGEDFLDGGDHMTTDNIVEKSGPFGIVIPYSMFKDFRWVETSHGTAMIARSWVPESGFAEGGENGILCGWTIEVWLQQDGGVLWYNSSWSRLKTIVDGLVTEEQLLTELIKGTLAYYEGIEAHVNGTE